MNAPFALQLYSQRKRLRYQNGGPFTYFFISSSSRVRIVVAVNFLALKQTNALEAQRFYRYAAKSGRVIRTNTV